MRVYGSLQLLRLLALVLLSATLCARASLHDHKRGFQTYNLPEKNVEKYLTHKSASAHVHRHNNREALKEHPDVQKYLQWRKMHKEGHPDAGAAFAGKIPHDFIHLLGQEHDEL